VKLFRWDHFAKHFYEGVQQHVGWFGLQSLSSVFKPMYEVTIARGSYYEVIMILRRILLIALCFWALSAFAEVREIELKDGSVITGTVRSFDGNHYVIDSKSLGTISLSSGQIKTIRSATVAGANQVISQSDVIGLQQRLLNDKDIMALLQTLQNDPQIQSILNDPKLIQSITAGDVKSLMNNPKFKALMDNPTIREITNKVSP
jgi:small nuclear ribonucleoprotein (snRNP)-like protein